MNKMIIAAFPQSIIKIVTQSEDNKVTAEWLVWMPQFKDEFPKIVSSCGELDGIHVLGPTAYVSKLIEFVEGVTDVPVIKEG